MATKAAINNQQANRINLTSQPNGRGLTQQPDLGVANNDGQERAQPRHQQLSAGHRNHTGEQEQPHNNKIKQPNLTIQTPCQPNSRHYFKGQDAAIAPSTTQTTKESNYS